MEKKLVAPHTTTRARHSSLMGSIYIAAVFLSFHYFFVLYINSSFLEQFVPKGVVGTLYTLGSALNIILFLYLPLLLRRFGNYAVFLALTTLEGMVLLGLALCTTPSIIILLFVIHHSLPALLLYSLDIFLEHHTKNKRTGRVRGLYLTILNSVVVVSPFIVGSMIKENNFQSVYLASALFLLPLFLIVLYRFRGEKITYSQDIHLSRTLGEFIANKNVFTIFIAMFLLQFFYATMVIYMPLHLSNTIGFTWREIGALFTIMLIPFVLFEIPLGQLADRKLGEKEILITGFSIAALSTLIIPHITNAIFVVWALLLFTTRIGASFIEIACESYFFKQVDESHARFISLFRSSFPLSYIVAPSIASLVILGFPLATLFTILGVLMLCGIVVSLRLVDSH
jgi:MFS family permease